MKRVLIALLCMVCGTLFSQSKQDDFIGTWKWEDQSSNSEIIIQLKTYTGVWGFFGDETTYTILVGAYSYKKDGIVVADYLDECSKNYSSWVPYCYLEYGRIAHKGLFIERWLWSS